MVMTPEEIIENNKLIAEFFTDGKTVRTAGGARAYVINGMPTKKDRLQFYLSWDWLMPVVEKIESLDCVVEITETFCHIYKENVGWINSDKGNCKTKIESVYKAVIQFINWHNQNK